VTKRKPEIHERTNREEEGRWTGNRNVAPTDLFEGERVLESQGRRRGAEERRSAYKKANLPSRRSVHVVT